MKKDSKNIHRVSEHELPNGWEFKELGKLVDDKRPVSYGIVQTGESVVGGIKCIRVTDIVDCNVQTENLITTSKKISDGYKRTLLKKGDLVMALRGKIGEIAMIEDDLVGANLTRGVALIALKNNFDAEYIKQQISCERTIKVFEKRLNGSALQELSIGILRKIPILYPRLLAEQKAIAKALKTWDDAINKMQALIHKKELRKKWLMQQLLTERKRFKGFSEEWKHIRFKEIYNQIKRRAGKEEHIILSVTKDGIVSQAEYFKKEIASEDTSSYLVIKRGDMVMSGLNFWMGSIDVLTTYEAGMVSPAYKAFEISNKNVSPEFMKHFVRSKVMLRALVGSSVIGASIVRRNMDREALDEWSFHLPPIKEQVAIARLLREADIEINLLKTKAEKLRRQKKGLTQILLTGKKRLNANE